MRVKESMVAASVFCVLVGSPAWAQQAAPAGELETLKRMMQEIISQNEDLKRRVRELEAGRAPAAAPAKPAAVAPATAPATATRGPLDRVQLGGALEVEVGSRRLFSRERSSDLSLNTAEFDFEADIVDWAKAELALEWDRDADTIRLNEALVTLAKPSKLPVYFKAGRGVVPFGISTGATVAARLEETLTITGPLTLEVFETKEDHALLGYRGYGFHAGAYVYNGTTDNRVQGKRLEHYGATLGYELKTDLLSFDAGVHWIDSVFDSNGLTDAFLDELVTRKRRPYVPGVAVHAKVGLWGFSLIGEYNAATRAAHFTREDPVTADILDIRSRPEAWQVEIGYTTSIFDKKTYGAFNYSETAALRGGFPQRRMLGTVGTWVADNIRVAAEYDHEQDYPRAQGGTGRDGHAWTLQLLYEW
jgi:hypothetical protein